MESIGDVMSRINSKHVGMSDEVCMEHEVQSNGKVFVKEIKKVFFDGEALCPLCENQRLTKELENQIKEKHEAAQDRMNYNIFHKQNIITDINLLDASFGNFETSEPEETENKDRAQKSFMQYRDGNTFNTWFTGPPGVGKSHLAMSILRNLNEVGKKDRSCLFVSVDSMLMRIRESFSDKESKYTEAYFINLLSSVDFLVLDDLGAETGGTGTEKIATDFTLRVLYAIANGRRDKSTIITTNLSRVELIKMYDPKLVSRLMGSMYRVHFKKTLDKRIEELEF